MLVIVSMIFINNKIAAAAAAVIVRWSESECFIISVFFLLAKASKLYTDFFNSCWTPCGDNLFLHSCHPYLHRRYTKIADQKPRIIIVWKTFERFLRGPMFPGNLFSSVSTSFMSKESSTIQDDFRHMEFNRN